MDAAPSPTLPPFSTCSCSPLSLSFGYLQTFGHAFLTCPTLGMSRLALNTAPDLTCLTSLSDSFSINVYHAVRSFLRAKHDPRNPGWARAILGIMVVAHFIMLFLALAVIFLRVPSRKFTLGSITRHGVLRPNATGCVTVCCILFDIFAIIGLAMQLAIDCGVSDPEAKVHIPGIKYIIIWIGVWCFCWSTACQYICARWDPPWQSGMADRTLNVVPFAVIVSLNVTFIGVAVVSIAISATIFTLSNQKYLELVRAIDTVGPTLISVNIKPYNSTSALEAMSALPGDPLHRLDHLIDEFSHWLKIRILTCLGLNSCLLIVYTPFIFFTYIQLKRFIQFAPKDWGERKDVPQKHHANPGNGIRIDYKKEMRSLLITAATIFSVFLVEWPLLVWEFLHISTGTCRSGEGLVIREMASDVIVSIIGNIIIGFTLAQTIRIVNPKPWDYWRLGKPKPKLEPPVIQSRDLMKISKSNRVIHTTPPVRELTVSVLQHTQSEASEPLEQPNFDVLHTWALRKTEQNEVIRHHLQLHASRNRGENEKAVEMDFLRPEGYH